MCNCLGNVSKSFPIPTAPDGIGYNPKIGRMLPTKNFAKLSVTL
jgi:hypothetical protein